MRKEIRDQALKDFLNKYDNDQVITRDDLKYIADGVRRVLHGVDPWPFQNMGRKTELNLRRLMGEYMRYKELQPGAKENDVIRALAGKHDVTEKTIRNRLNDRPSVDTQESIALFSARIAVDLKNLKGEE